MAISKSRRGSCFSSRNTNRLLVPSPLDLHLGRLLFLALLASCSALAIETTEVPEVHQSTTIIPAQVEDSLPTQTTNHNETTTSAHPVDTPKADATDPAVFDQSSGVEVQDSFVSVYGGNLEQDIKNDVNSEVEEAPAPAETLKETASKVEEVAAVETENRETEAAVQNAREPKTLDTEEEEGKPAPEDRAEPEEVTDNIAMASEQVESRSNSNRPLPAVTSDLVSVILNENRAITEQPITKTNLLALEQEHKAIEGESTPVPTFDEPKHQVTKKQGVEDLLPIEVAPEVLDEPEIAREERQFEEPNPNLNEIDGNNSEDEMGIPTTLFKSAGELQEEIEKKSEEEAKAEIETEVEGTAPPLETVVEAADPEDSQPSEEEDILGTTEKSVSEETKPLVEEPKEDEHKEEETQDTKLKEDETKEKELKEIEITEEEPKQEETKEEEPKEIMHKEEEPKDKEPLLKETLNEANESKDEGLKKEEPKQVEPKEWEVKKEEPQEEVTIHQIDSEEPSIPAGPSSTQKPVEKMVPLSTDGESVELKEEEHESVEGKDKDSESSEHKEDKDSSEETHEPAADEAKPSSSDDSTATPLVSYPPHDAGQTFDSNSADEHSAQLSGPSNYRSTLIIALCSGTAVIFIVASLVIFVVSFQRQHGTLDIEMQEQRLGKDDRDEEDAQVKLLEVDLSTPVIVSLGNEETDECL